MTDDRSSNHELLEEAQLHDIEQFYINTISSNSPIYPIGSLKEDITCMLADIRHLRSRAEAAEHTAESWKLAANQTKDLVYLTMEQAEAAEQERDKLLLLVDKIETALEPPYFPESEYAAYVSDAITAYREGSKPDATE